MSAEPKNLLVAIFLIISSAHSFAKVEAVIGPTSLANNSNIAINLPDTNESEILISRDQYLISYNKNRRAPNYVAWKIERSQLGNAGRSDNFQQDPDLENYLNHTSQDLHGVDATDYKNSCFDRGHQVPSGDRTDTKANNEPTFVMSNMIPQTAYLNRVIWEHLESYTRDLVTGQGKKIYVFAGPIYDLDFGAIGPNRDIPVPSKDFKIILILEANQTPRDIGPNTPVISVIMPNVLKDGSQPVPYSTGCGGSAIDTTGATASDDWKQYQTTISDIEAKSGLDFHSSFGKAAAH